jgi:hypothetical protein
MAVIRNGHARTTIDVDVITFRKDWVKALPLQGEIVSEGVDIGKQCMETFKEVVREAGSGKKRRR